MNRASKFGLIIIGLLVPMTSVYGSSTVGDLHKSGDQNDVDYFWKDGSRPEIEVLITDAAPGGADANDIMAAAIKSAWNGLAQNPDVHIQPPLVDQATGAFESNECDTRDGEVCLSFKTLGGSANVALATMDLLPCDPDVTDCRAPNYVRKAVIRTNPFAVFWYHNQYEHNSDEWGPYDCELRDELDGPSTIAHYYFESVIYHEIGHVLGLHDLLGSGQSSLLMYFDEDVCDYFSNISQFSIDRLEELYPGGNTEININQPPDDSTFQLGSNITFSADATFRADGSDVSDSIRWTSSLDGQFGTGPSVMTHGLRVGEHRITATVDPVAKTTPLLLLKAEPLSGSASINLTIEGPTGDIQAEPNPCIRNLTAGEVNCPFTLTWSTAGPIDSPVVVDSSGDVVGQGGASSQGGLQLSRAEPGDTFTLYNTAQGTGAIDAVDVDVVHPTATLEVSHESGEPANVGCEIDPGSSNPDSNRCTITLSWNSTHASRASVWAYHHSDNSWEQLSTFPSGELLLEDFLDQAGVTFSVHEFPERTSVVLEDDSGRKAQAFRKAVRYADQYEYDDQLGYACQDGDPWRPACFGQHNFHDAGDADWVKPSQQAGALRIETYDVHPITNNTRIELWRTCVDIEQCGTESATWVRTSWLGAEPGGTYLSYGGMSPFYNYWLKVYRNHNRYGVDHTYRLRYAESFFQGYRVVTRGAAQDPDGRRYQLLDGGDLLRLRGNSWKAIAWGARQVTANTILEIDFRAVAGNAEIQGVGLAPYFSDTSEAAIEATFFQFAGTQNYGNQGYRSATPGTIHTYRIPIGQHIPAGTYRYLVVANDDDAARSAVGDWRNVRLYEGTLPDQYENDGGEARDDAASGASSYSGVVQTNHNFHVQGDTDWVAVTTPDPGTIRFETLNLGANADTALEVFEYASASSAGMKLGDSNDGASRPSRLDLFLEPGAYYTRLTSQNGAFGQATDYDLRINYVLLAPDPFENDGGASNDNTPANASSYIGATQYNHQFHNRGDVDWVAVYYGTPGTLRFRTFGLGPHADTYIDVYEYVSATQRGPWLFGSGDGGARASDVQRFLAPGASYVRIRSQDRSLGPGTGYDFNIGYVNDTPDAHESQRSGPRDDYPSGASHYLGYPQYNHNFDRLGDDDWIAVATAQANTLKVRTYNFQAHVNTRIELYQYRSSTQAGSLLASTNAATLYKYLPAGAYYVRIVSEDRAFGPGTDYDVEMTSY